MSKFSDLVNGEVPVLVDVHATWCGPCKQLAPTISQLSHEYAGRIKVIKVDIDQNQQFAQNHQIQGVPTLLLYKKGEIVWRQSGVLPKHLIAEQIDQALL